MTFSVLPSCTAIAARSVSRSSVVITRGREMTDEKERREDARPRVVFDKIACALEVFDKYAPALFRRGRSRMKSRIARAIALAHVVPDESELPFGFVEKSGLDLFAVELAFILQQMIEVGRAGDLQKVGEITRRSP